jgi:hypothetical protein
MLRAACGLMHVPLPALSREWATESVAKSLSVNSPKTAPLRTATRLAAPRYCCCTAASSTSPCPKWWTRGGRLKKR